jgi:glycosyltransferase involved in cell wall biosynthesis
VTESAPRILVMTVVHRPDDARILHRQIRILRLQGFRVTYAAPWSAVGVTAPEGLAVRDLPRSAGRDRLTALRAAVRLLRAEADAHDLVLIHDPELVLAVRLAGVERLPPVVWDVHEDTAVALSGRTYLPRALRRPLVLAVRRLERWAERHVHLVLAEDGYRSRFRREHPVVRNLPWAPGRDVTATSVVGEADLGVSHGSLPVVLHVGRLSRGRGLIEMLDLGRRLTGAASVELVGPVDEELRDELETAVADGAVRWHGFVPNDALGPLLARASVGLSLLHDEPNYLVSLPTKVLEYLVHGLPVVATPLPEVARLVSEGGGALLVAYRDVDGAEAAVRRILGEPGLRARLADEARALAASRTWEAEGARLASTLRGWARTGAAA